jgi:hypothetical protein
MVAKVGGIRALIDRGHSLDKAIKVMNNELDGIKAKIRQHAKATQNSKINGTTSKVLVSDTSTSYIDPMKVWVLMGKNIRDFKNVIKVIKGTLKGYLDEEQITKISVKDTNKFNSVRFYDVDDIIDDNGRLVRRMDNG